jgi:hypothetical protein
VLLADNCPKSKKAFELQKRGVVLGVGFDSTRQEWFYTKAKADKIKNVILPFLRKTHTSLKEMQRIMGMVNNMALIIPFLKFYKFAGNQLMGKFAGNEELVLAIPSRVKEDLLVCMKVVEDAMGGLPIANRPCPPPLSALHFYSDAAEGKFALHRGARVNQNIVNDRGVACLLIQDSAVSWACAHTWPMYLLNEATDSKGSHYGSKMVTSECVGLLLPFLCIPERLSGKDVVFHVDNIAVVYVW